MKKKGDHFSGLNVSVATQAKKTAVFTLLVTFVLVAVLMAWEMIFGAPITPSKHAQHGMGSAPMEYRDWTTTHEEIIYDDSDPELDKRFAVEYNPPLFPLTVVSNNLERKIVKTGSLALFVDDVEKTTDGIRSVAERFGGFVGSSQIYEVSEDTKAASITLCVPAVRFQDAMQDIKKLGARVDRESIGANDTTDQMVDFEARLKNLRAEEEQYVIIMAEAATVEDTLKVAEHLSRVREDIELLDAQLISLRNQVDMSTISVSLTAEADVEVFGIRWKPLFVVKQAFRNMIADFTDYTNNMIYFVFKLPVLLLWLATIAAIALILWNIIIWIKNQIL